MSKRLVCICNGITEKEIIETLKKGARTTADIQRITGAGTSCGRCLVTVDALVEEFPAQQTPDPQLRIGFGERFNCSDSEKIY